MKYLPDFHKIHLMGKMCATCTSLAKWTAFVIGLIAILVYAPIPPHATFSETFIFAANRPLTGNLAIKEKLENAELWHKGNLIGPETFTDYNGELYTSLYTGDVVKFQEDETMVTIVKTGQSCKGNFEEKICGRSMGIKFDDDGRMFVADAYYGIFKVDVGTAEKELLISPNELIGGKKPKLFNSIYLTKNGDIYWSDSSTEFSFEDVVYDMLADASGRLIFYNATSKTNTVLIDKVAFANGVFLSENEEFVLVAESGRNRIHRYYRKGSKNGTTDIFVDGLPGMPDNIQSDGQGGFLVALYMAVDDDNPSILQILSDKPTIRKILAKTMGLGELIFQIINSVYPAEIFQRAIHFIGHGNSMYWLNPPRATVLRISKDGEILESLHNLNKHISLLSEAYIFKNMLYLGTPYNDYIARITLSEIGWQHLEKNIVESHNLTGH